MAERVGVTGKEQTQGPGKAKNPTAYRYFLKDVVNEMSRRLDHSPRAAGGKKPTTFAGERNHVLVAASVALHTLEPMFESAAAQIVLELSKYEPR